MLNYLSLNLYEMLYLPFQRKGHIYNVLAEVMNYDSKTIKRYAKKLQNESFCYDFEYWLQHHQIKDFDFKIFELLPDNLKKHLYTLPQLKNFSFEKLNIPNEFKGLCPFYLKFAYTLLGVKLGIANYDMFPLFEPVYQFLIKQLFIFSDMIYYYNKGDYENYLSFIDKLHFPFQFPKVVDILSSANNLAIRKYCADLLLFLFLLFDMVILTDELAPKSKKGTSYFISAFSQCVKEPNFSYKKYFYETRKNFVIEQCGKVVFSDLELYKIMRTQEDSDTEDEQNKKLCNDIKFEKFPRPKRLINFLNKIYKNLSIDEITLNEQIRYDISTYALIFLIEQIKKIYINEYGTLENIQNQLLLYQDWICRNILKCTSPTQISR